ncbi:MAG: M23 family metallopeptidase [candidate division WOR-3 bacterium]|nr:MAG: M23 family metallopeptidase [candidate division WOR-3 bacterium]
MKKGYSVLIVSDDSKRSKHYFISKKNLRILGLVSIALLLVIVIAGLNYSLVYVRALEVGMLRRRNAELEEEFSKIEEIRENLRLAEANNQRIKVMLGIEKTPELVEPVVTETRPHYTDIEVLKEIPENIPSLLPTMGQISRDFGPGHFGIDIAAAQFSPVISAASGIVEGTGWDSLYGNYVVIEHNRNYSTFYGHLNSIDVLDGVRVTAGQVIGTVGSTGRSTSSHLHYEVRFRYEPVDPMGYIPFFVKL